MADKIITRGDGNRNPDWPNALQSAYDGLSSLYSAMLALDSLTSGAGPSAGVLAPLGVDRYEASALMGAAYNLWRKAEAALAPAFAAWERGTAAAESVAARLDDHLRRLGVPDDADTSPCCGAALVTIYSPRYTGKGRGVKCQECGTVYDPATLAAPIQPEESFSNYFNPRLGINS